MYTKKKGRIQFKTSAPVVLKTDRVATENTLLMVFQAVSAACLEVITCRVVGDEILSFRDERAKKRRHEKRGKKKIK